MGAAGTFSVTATGFPAPSVSVSGSLPTGVTFNTTTDVLSGTPTTTGTFPITFTAQNGVSPNATQSFTLTVIAPVVGSLNVVPKWLDGMGTLGSSQITDDGTNVNMPGSLGAMAYKFTGNATPPADSTATIYNLAFVGPVFSGFSFKVRTGAPVPADALTVDQNQNVSTPGNASALAFTFTGNATPPTDSTATIYNQAFVGPVFSGLSFKVRTGAAVPADAMTVDQNQNVGLGTATPTHKLDVAGIVKVSGSGNLQIKAAGGGIVVKSPDGTKCAQIGIDNTGKPAVTAVACQ
jgi:hypothetical protein